MDAYGTPQASKEIDGTRIFRWRRCARGHKIRTVELRTADPADLRRLEGEIVEARLKEMEDANDPIAPFLRDLFHYGGVGSVVKKGGN